MLRLGRRGSKLSDAREEGEERRLFVRKKEIRGRPACTRGRRCQSSKPPWIQGHGRAVARRAGPGFRAGFHSPFYKSIRISASPSAPPPSRRSGVALLVPLVVAAVTLRNILLVYNNGSRLPSLGTWLPPPSNFPCGWLHCCWWCHGRPREALTLTSTLPRTNEL